MGARFVSGLMEQELGTIWGKTILDAGSGPGLASLRLPKKGAHLTLLDTDPRALEIARQLYGNQHVEYVQGSILRLPFPRSTFDVVLNTGLLEHFSNDGQFQALLNMARVGKRDGMIVTLNPTPSMFYEWVKVKSEKRGTWDVGEEYPIRSLKMFFTEEFDVWEQRVGFLAQFQYLKYLLPRWARIPFVLAFEIAMLLGWHLNYLPGSLLLTVIRSRKNEGKR